MDEHPEPVSQRGRGGRRRPVWLRPWAELTDRQRAVVLTLGSVQLSLAASAWADLATRPAAEVNGSKARWALAIAVGWIGPLAWFRRGRRR
ncbi:hypothetical protein [Modestobacter sp. SYSU DS0290]